MRASGFPDPAAARAERPPATGRWLRKPLRSAGGRHPLRSPGEAPSPKHYFQEFVDGSPMSAALLVHSESQSNCRRVVASREAVRSDCGTVGCMLTGRFEYCREHRARVRLPRLSGVDVSFCAACRLPRGSAIFAVHRRCRFDRSRRRDASVLESLIRAYPGFGGGVGTGDRGRAAFGSGSPSLLAAERQGVRPSVVGKAIYYAPHRLTFPALADRGTLISRATSTRGGLPAFADIPTPGAVNRDRLAGTDDPGSRVPRPQSVRERLQSRAAELDNLLADASP